MVITDTVTGMTEQRSSRRLLPYIATLAFALTCVLTVVVLGFGREPAVTGDDGSFYIKLDGVDGVTPQQQAAAEQLLSSTRREVARFAKISAGEVAPGEKPVCNHEHEPTGKES